jgi:hypothetical protein
LHGLNAVHLSEFGWYRVDSSGNKLGVNARFSPPTEPLAFRPSFSEERDFPEVLSDPLLVVVTTLRKYSTWNALYNNLPDWGFSVATRFVSHVARTSGELFMTISEF